MHRLLKVLHTLLWTLIGAAQVACVPAPSPTLTPSPSAAPTETRPPIKTPTRTPTPGATSTPTPLMPTTTLFPSATPISCCPSPPTLAVPVTFNSIQMMDRSTGWAMAEVGSEDERRALRTTDGGAVWHDVTPLEVDFYGAVFLDAQTAWAWPVYGSQAWRTEDGGETWTLLEDSAGQAGIGFVDSQHGWKLVGESWGLSFVQFDIVSFSTTQDGGTTWQETNPPPGGGSAYMAYPSAQTAWALRAGFAKTIEGVPNLGVPFRIETTFDGGSTWTTRQMPLPPESFRVERPYEGTYLGGVGNCEFISPVYSTTAIWKLALTCEDQSWMYTSANQGQTWIISDMPAGLDADIDFIDATTGWLLIGAPYESPEGHLYQTTNGGRSWTLIKRTGWTDARLSFVDAQTGWAVACSDAYCYQTDAQRALIKTTDGGRTWQILEPRVTP